MTKVVGRGREGGRDADGTVLQQSTDWQMQHEGGVEEGGGQREEVGQGLDRNTALQDEHTSTSRVSIAAHEHGKW